MWSKPKERLATGQSAEGKPRGQTMGGLRNAGEQGLGPRCIAGDKGWVLVRETVARQVTKPLVSHRTSCQPTYIVWH